MRLLVAIGFCGGLFLAQWLTGDNDYLMAVADSLLCLSAMLLMVVVGSK